MNSFAAMARAIDYEVDRQVSVLSDSLGGAIVQETRLWEEGGQRTVSMRKKEGLADYRYFPEPDLPAVLVTQALLDAVLRDMPELPAQARNTPSLCDACSPHGPCCASIRSGSATLHQPGAATSGTQT